MNRRPLRTLAALGTATVLLLAPAGAALAGPGHRGDDDRGNHAKRGNHDDHGEGNGKGKGHGKGNGKDHDEVASTRHLDLPAGFQPEGIAIGEKGRHGRTSDMAYLGSRADGDILRLDLRSGRSTVITQGPGTPSLGMKVDGRDRLFVAGGTGGDARVIDTRTGAVLASYRLVEGTAFINDVILTKDAAWFTDSANAQLFKLPLAANGTLPTQAQVVRVPLTGAWAQVAGNNANGITTTPDGRALLVVNSTSGLLYRVDPATGVASVVDLGGASVSNGDGLLLEGRRLYVVRNQLNTIAVFDLDRAGTTGRASGTITDPDFDVPTTVARSGDRLYLPNARFTTPATATTPYWVTGVGVDEEHGQGNAKGHDKGHKKGHHHR